MKTRGRKSNQSSAQETGSINSTLFAADLAKGLDGDQRSYSINYVYSDISYVK